MSFDKRRRHHRGERLVPMMNDIGGAALGLEGPSDKGSHFFVFDD